jgi:hypothetical protein
MLALVEDQAADQAVELLLLADRELPVKATMAAEVLEVPTAEAAGAVVQVPLVAMV